MATIQDPVPEAPKLPANFKRRVVIKFKPGVQLSYSKEAAGEFAKQSENEWSSLAVAFDGVALTPYFSTLEESSLRALMQRGASATPTANTPDLTLYYAIECPSGVDPESVAKMAAEWPNVEIAYAEPLPLPPPGVNAADDPRSPLQGYHNAAPAGIDARWVWNLGIDGSGARLVDLERGWVLNHEDLAAANITIISGINDINDSWHGTAVLGVLAAIDNTIGGVGIAPACNTRVVSEWRSNSSTSSIYYSTAEAILSAVMNMSSGDVLLLETSTGYETVPNIAVPVEVYPVNFDAIRIAVSMGITVIEAAGSLPGLNPIDLDTFQDTSGKKILNRTSGDFQDSGAIMVGAASSAVPHTRLSFSNFGSRIDCYAWGENIDTTGGPDPTITNSYTPGFGGTSGASAIVTGAALLLQSWRVTNGNAPYAPDDMRVILSDPDHNTNSANPSTDRIGAMPDLKRIIQLQQSGGSWLKVYVAIWAFIIIVGGLMITNGGVWCIKCVLNGSWWDRGDPLVTALGAVLIIAGGIGMARAIMARR